MSLCCCHGDVIIRESSFVCNDRAFVSHHAIDNYKKYEKDEYENKIVYSSALLC